jgi:hypothetical protein
VIQVVARIDTETPLKLWITSSGELCKAPQESGFYPPLLRGIAHRTIRVSPLNNGVSPTGHVHKAAGILVF